MLVEALVSTFLYHDAMMAVAGAGCDLAGCANELDEKMAVGGIAGDYQRAGFMGQR